MDLRQQAQELRTARIPQLVGMSIGARLVGADLSHLLASELRELADPKIVAERFGCDAQVAETLTPAISGQLAALERRVRHLCSELAEAWRADAYRAEGRAEALEELDRGSSPGGPVPAPTAE